MVCYNVVFSIFKTSLDLNGDHLGIWEIWFQGFSFPQKCSPVVDRREVFLGAQSLNISWPCSACNTVLLPCLPSDQLNLPDLFNLLASLKTQSSVTRFIASFYFTFHWNPLQFKNPVSPHDEWDTKRKMQKYNLSRMQRITRGCVSGQISTAFPPCAWMTLSCAALCRWV